MQLPEIKGLTVKAICAAVCAHYDVLPVDFMSPRLFKELNRARQTAMWLARRYTDLSLPEIGRRIGGRAHTTILSGVRNVDQAISTDASLRRDMFAITAVLAAVAENGLLARQLKADRDPLQLVVDCLNGVKRDLSLSSDELLQILLLCAGYAVRVGDLRDAEAQEEQPDTTPAAELPMIRHQQLDRLFARAASVARTRSDLLTNQHTRFERTSREAFETSLDALTEQVNEIRKGLPA